MIAGSWPIRVLRVTSGLSCIWFLPLPIVYSQSGTGIIALLYTVYGWALLALLFAGTLAFSRQARRAERAHRLATPLVLLLAAALLAMSTAPLTNPLFRLRFELSRSALTEAAVRKLADPATELSSWVGLFPVLSADVHHGTVRFIATNCGVVDACGLVYSPNSVPRRVHEDAFVELSAAWYHVHQGF
ncbi:MAG: hypothetical protein KIT17_06315 [Rubrivivax sp.]|nr:hypothetical protein [Rubrivivax sp.]